MSLTSSPRTRLPQHSTGWGALRIITDRAGKYLTETPAHWGRRRAMTRGDIIKLMVHIRGPRP